MANMRNEAGEWCRTQSQLLQRRNLMFVGMSCLLLYAGVFFLWGFLWNVVGLLLACVIFLVTTLLMVFLVNRIVRRSDRFMKERRKFLRGFDGEGLVSWTLDGLDNDWWVFNNVMMTPTSDIDHIVVGPSGLCLLSTKSHTGTFAYSPAGDLLHNGQPCPFADDAMQQMGKLKNKLHARLGDWIPWITVLLVTPFAHVDGMHTKGKVWLIH